jgi:S-formylglutathione hydrolase
MRRWSRKTMTAETVSLNRSHGGMQGVYKHGSRETGTSMTFSVYVPPHQGNTKLPVSGIYQA